MSHRRVFTFLIVLVFSIALFANMQQDTYPIVTADIKAGYGGEQIQDSDTLQKDGKTSSGCPYLEQMAKKHGCPAYAPGKSTIKESGTKTKLYEL